MLSEWMKYTFFETNPIDTLLIRNKDQKYIVNKYLDGVEYNDRSKGFDPTNQPTNKEEKQLVYVRNSFPERWDDCYERAVEVQKQLYWGVRNFKHNSDVDSN
jgi:hypothetical protein